MTVYVLVLVVYLGALAAVGVKMSGRSRSAGDFAIGGRQVGPWVTALSFVAAYYSSVVIIGGGAFGWRYGLATLWIGAGNVLLGTTLAWIVLGRRVRRMTGRLDAMTLPGFFAARYGSPQARLFSAAVTGLFLVVYNVSVLKGMANAFEVLMDLPYWAGVLISGVVILFYTAVGGYLAVVWTSMIQAIVMIAALLLLTFMSLQKVGGMAELVARLSAVDPGLVTTPGTWGWAGLVSFTLIVSLGTWGMPQLLVRFYSIRDDRMLRAGTVIVTVGASIALLPYLNGAVARVLVPTLDSADQAIPALTQLVLNDWGGALFLAGVVAAGMSTFAGVLIIIASSLVRDVWIEGLGRPLAPATELRASRLTSLAVGVVSLLIALKPPALVLVLTAFSWAVIASTNLWPLLFGIYWRRTSARATLASMVAGTTAALLWQAWPRLGWLPGLPPGLAGVHGFVVGTAVALVVILIGTLAGRPAPVACVRRAWGEPAAGDD
ncbi:MAG: sodium/proline symporter [Krumholzibacteria bacterium]|nr:sodium/proline symporter [Candidatus Krumholzibacteria bacterium]